MKLRKEVKQILIGIGIIALLVIIITVYEKMTTRAYNKCLIENNNNVNFCHRLAE